MSFRLRSRIRLRRSPRLSIAMPTNCWPERAGCRRTSPTSSSADRSSWRRYCGPPRVSRPRTSPGWPAKCNRRRASDGLGGVSFNGEDADAKEDADYMTKFVPYLADQMIESDAALLLTEYAHACGIVIAPPIPIEDIVEKHLKLGIEFDDTHKLFGVPRSGLDPDILAAIFFDDRRIVIDESLDPEENPAKEGRYRFTLAHEGGGHWRLHRHLFAKDPAQISLFNEPAPPSVVCRSSQAKEPVEWQADFYASCLLMPRKLIFETWRERFGTTAPFIFEINKFNPTLALRRSNWIHISKAVQTEPDAL